MLVKKIKRLIFAFTLCLLPSMGFSQTLMEKLELVESAQQRYLEQFKPVQLYDKYISRDPVASIRPHDLMALQTLIRLTGAYKLKLHCQASEEKIRSRELKEREEYCADGVKYANRIALHPRVANVLTSQGHTLNISVGLKRPASGFCTAIANQQGLFVGAVVNSYGQESLTSFHIKETQTLNSSNASDAKKLTMALATCCMPEDNQEENCLQRLENAYQSLAGAR